VLLGLVLAEHDHARAVLGRLAQRTGRLPHADGERLDRTCVEVEIGPRQALQRDAGELAARRRELHQSPGVRGRLDAEPFGAIFDPQRLDLDPHGRRGEQREREHPAAVLDAARVARERDLAPRMRLDAALIERIEAAQRFDLVAEELDPQRPLRREREDVEDLAAQARLARLLRQRLASESGLDQPLEQAFAVELLMDREHQQVALDLPGGGDRLQQREQ
jgi:hypothetical protein